MLCPRHGIPYESKGYLGIECKEPSTRVCLMCVIICRLKIRISTSGYWKRGNSDRSSRDWLILRRQGGKRVMQYEMFKMSFHGLPEWQINKIKALGEAGWKVAAVAAELKVSEFVVTKYFKRFKIKRRPYTYRPKI